MMDDQAQTPIILKRGEWGGRGRETLRADKSHTVRSVRRETEDKKPTSYDMMYYPSYNGPRPTVLLLFLQKNSPVGWIVAKRDGNQQN